MAKHKHLHSICCRLRLCRRILDSSSASKQSRSQINSSSLSVKLCGRCAGSEIGFVARAAGLARPGQASIQTDMLTRACPGCGVMQALFELPTVANRGASAKIKIWPKPLAGSDLKVCMRAGLLICPSQRSSPSPTAEPTAQPTVLKQTVATPNCSGGQAVTISEAQAKLDAAGLSCCGVNEVSRIQRDGGSACVAQKALCG